MHNDFLHKLTQKGRGKFFKAGVLADNIHKLFCVYRGFLRFGKLCPDSGGSLFQFFVMCYELIQLVIEKNNLHDLDTWIFFKWIFKTFVAVLLVTNTWNGLYRPLVLYPFQNREPCKERLFGTLRG